MFSDKVMGVLRAVLAGAGGLVVGLGIADTETWAQIVTSFDTIIGAAGVIAAAVGSIVAKMKAPK